MIYNSEESPYFNGRGGFDSGLWQRPPIPSNNDQSKFWTSQSHKNLVMRQTPTLGNNQNQDKSNGLWGDPNLHNGTDQISDIGNGFSGLGIYEKVEFPNPTGANQYHQWGQAEINQAAPWDIDALPFNNGNFGSNGKNQSEIQSMLNPSIYSHQQQQWGTQNFPHTQPNMGMPNHQNRIPPYSIRPQFGNPPPMGMMGGPPPSMSRPPMTPMQTYGNGPSFPMGTFTPQQEPLNEDVFWHDPNGDMRKWQRDTGTAIWGDPVKQSVQKIVRWTQPPDPEEEKRVETVAFKDENGTLLNPAWPELPPITNQLSVVQSVPSNANGMNQKLPVTDGWMNPGNGAMSQNVWPDQSRPLNGIPKQFSGQMPPVNGGNYQLDVMNDWVGPPTTLANPIFGQNGIGEHFVSNGMKPRPEPIVQKFADSLQTAVNKGLLNMNILYNFTANSTNGQLPPNIIYYIRHILSRVDSLEQANQKAEILKHSTNTVQRNEYERLSLEIHAIQTEIAEICDKINCVISPAPSMPKSAMPITNMPPPKLANTTNGSTNSMWSLPPTYDSGTNSSSSSRLIDDLINLEPRTTMPELGGESIW